MPKGERQAKNPNVAQAIYEVLISPFFMDLTTRERTGERAKWHAPSFIDEGIMCQLGEKRECYRR